MGLDTTHNCWHGPYSSFGNFRKFLANQIGIDLNDYIGYGNLDATKELNTIDHKLMPLFDHSDCDSILTVEEAKQIAEGLDEVLEKFLESEDLDNQYYRDKMIQFRDGCLLAVANNEEIEFC